MTTQAPPRNQVHGHGEHRQISVPVRDEILEEELLTRAERLAAPERDTEDSRQRTAVVSFLLHGQRYGVPLREAEEVIPLSTGLTLIPGAPPEVLGLLNRRGELLLVLDAAGMLDARSSGDAGSEKRRPVQVLVLTGEHRSFGLGIGEVEGVEHVLIDPLHRDDGHERPCILGMTDDLRLILDADSLGRHPLIYGDG